MAAVTPEEMRQMLADQENRMARLIKSEVQPLKDQAQRIEIQTVKTNGRVTSLEGWRISTEARAVEREIAVREAATLVAEQAREALASRERSRRWWLGVITAWGVSIASISTLASLFASYLHHF